MSGVAGVGVRGHEVDPWGRYYTPPSVARQCVAAIPWGIDEPDLILEPSAGAGAFVCAARERWPFAHIDACEPDPDAPVGEYESEVTCLHRDYFEGSYGGGQRSGSGGPDMIIGNPPYRRAEEHIIMALRVVRPGGVVAMLLRLGVLEGVARQERLWSEYPPESVHVLVRRPRFEGPGGAIGRTDASAYAWIRWVRGGDGACRMGWIR